MELGWKPEATTASGKPKLDEAVLETIDLPEAQTLIDYMLITKRLGQLADGDKGWLRLVHNGKIHTTYNIAGTTTFRSSHGNPNIAQVPKVRATKQGVLYGVSGGWGYECRELFKVPPTWLLVGADMASCQLRALGHYVAKFDGGDYARIVVDGDIHQYHLDACSPLVKSRDDMKNTGYAYLFGAMDKKLGNMNGGNESLGKSIRQRLLTRVKGLGDADGAVQKEVKAKGYLVGLDGRRIYCTSLIKDKTTKKVIGSKPDPRKALNYQLQSWEAIICKRWIVDFYDYMQANGYVFGWDGDYVIVGYIHDELQVAARESLAETVGKALVHCAIHAGDHYNIRVKLGSDYKIGSNWAETH